MASTRWNHKQQPQRGCTFEPFLFDYFDTLIGRTTPNCWCHMLLNDHSTRFPGFPQTNRTLQSKYIQILKTCVWQPAYTCRNRNCKCIFPFACGFFHHLPLLPPRPPRPSTGSRLLPELAISLWSPPRRGTTSCGEKDDQFRTNEKSNQEVLLHVYCRGILLACWYVISKWFEKSVTSLENELYLAVNDCFWKNHCYQSLIILILWHQSSPKERGVYSTSRKSIRCLTYWHWAISSHDSWLTNKVNSRLPRKERRKD